MILTQGKPHFTAAFARAVIQLHFGAGRPIALRSCAGKVMALQAGSMACGWRFTSPDRRAIRVRLRPRLPFRCRPVR